MRCECTYVPYNTSALLPNNRYADSMIAVLSNLAMMRYNHWKHNYRVIYRNDKDNHVLVYPHCKRIKMNVNKSIFATLSATDSRKF